MYKVIVLKEGYNISEASGHQKACGSITLIKGPKNIIVDTGNPWDKDLILEGLKKNGLALDKVYYVVCTHGHSDRVGNLNLFSNAMHIVSHDVCYGDKYLGQTGLRRNSLTEDNIEYVICTHGHSDHVGNLNLFLHATHIVSHDICLGDDYISHDFNQGIPFEIDDNVEVIPTAGHTGSDVSVLVHNTDQGVVAVTGDLFECFEDLENPHLWQDNSENPEVQQQYRIKVLRKADYIIPGHGKMFKVPDEYKQQMRVVMYYEEHSYKQGEGTTSQYFVWEEEDKI